MSTRRKKNKIKSIMPSGNGKTISRKQMTRFKRKTNNKSKPHLKAHFPSHVWGKPNEKKKGHKI